MATKKRRRATTTDPIEQANCETDKDFVAAYLAPGAPECTPWTTQWTHPHTGRQYRLSIACARNMGEASLEACYTLVEETSRADYEASAQRWRPAHKRREMHESDLRYIVVEEEEYGRGDEDMKGDGDVGADGHPGSKATDTAKRLRPDTEVSAKPNANPNKQPVQPNIRGFTSLMPTFEGGQPVVYCYEIHLKPELHGTGLGGLLLGFLSIVGYNLAPIGKVMLTCFLSNTRALRFYHKHGFHTDEIAPAPRLLRGKIVAPDYTILSKAVQR